MTQPFELTGPLPEGVTVLEASAGTGKTYTIAALAARYVAEGRPLDELLLVTFTRMATGELRERVRSRLVDTEAALRAGEPGDDGVAALLLHGDPDLVEQRCERLARAVADFDAATITTTHGFCLDALTGLGLLGDVERDCTVAEDAMDLLDEVVDDLYVRRFLQHTGPPPISADQARTIAQLAVRNPEAPLEPDDARPDSVAAMRVRLARAAREELERRKRTAGVLTYDDLLTRLHATLTGPSGDVAVERLRRRYRVVLVDEFQDTDPLQWEIVRRAFAAPEPGRALVLIGDPKQAIYAFRGADVHAYLRAREQAALERTLMTNWRSDGGLLRALHALLGDVPLGHPAIVAGEVHATPDHEAARLRDAPVGAPLRVRIVDRSSPFVETTPGGFVKAAPGREFVADDLASEVIRMLQSEATVDGKPVEPGDFAVLVRTHRQATLAYEALGRANVPAVIGGAGSVFLTPAGDDWLRLLEALERPTSTLRVRAAVMTAFFGWRAADVAVAQDDAWEDVHRKLHAWARVLRTRGVATLTEVVLASEAVPARVLGAPDGERRMTDLRHVGQLLHEAAMRERLGVAALAAWLRARIDAAEREGDEERARRLESDAAAVQVLTIHRSKGLEFPIVLCPFMWDPPWRPDDPQPVVLHDAERNDVRVLDVGLEGPGYAAHRRQAQQEDEDEELRLTYVALTRARHQAVLWWAGAWSKRTPALNRLVFGRQEDGTLAQEVKVPSDAGARAGFEAVAARAPGCVSIEASERLLVDRWSPGDDPLPVLDTATFDRELDTDWRRTSFSALTAGTHDAPAVGSEAEERVVEDEPAVVVESDVEDHLVTPLAALPGGTRFGTVVHRVLEEADFSAPDLVAELAARLDEVRGVAEVGDPDALAHGLADVLATPLGPDLPALAGVASSDRLDELEFELPLAGGDEPREAWHVAALADAIARHGEPVPGYAARLRDEVGGAPLRGYLTGTIDLVWRVDGRFAIVDWKTNRLLPGDAVPRVRDFGPEALGEAMSRSHYLLQGTLYAVALHRYLRYRLKDYDPDRHLAGVHYLFVRGMAGEATPIVDGARCGVFSWQPSGALLDELSGILDGRVAA